MIDIQDTGLVYCNPKPTLKSIHAWFPSVTFFPGQGPANGDSNGGELVVSFHLAEAIESLDYRAYVSRSTDMGKSWSEPARIFHEKLDRPTVHNVRISKMADDTLVAFGSRIFRDDPNQGLTNRENLGILPMELILLRSNDRGYSWKGPQTIEPPLVGPGFEICHSVLELDNGRWIAPLSTWRSWDGEAPNGMNAYLLVSNDRGETWPEYVPVMNAYGADILHWEQSVTQMSDGRLLAVAWAIQEKSGQTLPTPYTISTDDSRFMPSMRTGIHAQTAKIISLANSNILCLYRRHDYPGLWANLARIEDNKWVNIERVPLWNGAESGMNGKQTIGDALGNLKFGYPNMVQLPDGDIFVVFWCLEDCIHIIRWFRLRIRT